MHVLANHVTLRLDELKSYGSSYIGKQEFNLNILDVVVGPGDYNLQIEQPLLSSWHEYQNWSWLNGKSEADKEKETQFSVCGIFSFHGRITPVSDIGAIKGETKNKCEVKEVFPTKIYKNEA